MRLALTACTLAVILLVTLSLTAPVVFHGQIISLQVNVVPDKQSAYDEPKSQMAEMTKYFRELTRDPLKLALESLTNLPDEAGDTLLLVHNDARFYRGRPVSDEERTDTLHHMIRAYLSTFRDLDVETWIAHGTLLGWWWNEKILPWDSDLDMQVSDETLAKMGEFLNHTTHTYRSDDIERDYFLDVNPFYKERTRGDGSNIIDARWIDVRNGLFIDITGISETDPVRRPGIWSCKNAHVYNTEDIWPLRMSYFEGAQAMIPNAYDTVLVQEYEAKALNQTEFEGHRWDDKLRQWIDHHPPPPPPSPVHV